MQITREFHVGDTLTSLLANLYYPSGKPYVLGAADTVAFRMVSSAGVVKVDNSAAAVVSTGSPTTNTPAQVRYDWGAADVDTAGIYAAWFIVTSGGETQHFPIQTYSSPEFEITFKADV